MSFRSLIDDCQNLLDNLRVQYRSAVERDCNPELALPYIRWLPFERRCSRAARNSTLSGSAAAHRGSSGIHFDGRGQDFAAEKHVSLIGRQRFEVKLGGFLDTGHDLFEGHALGLAALKFGTPRIKPVLILLDDDGRLAEHATSLRFRRCLVWSSSMVPE